MFIRISSAVLLVLGSAGWVPAAGPRVWLADQGNNQVGPANPNNRIIEIDPFNLKDPPDPDGTDVIILNTLPSPAGAFLDELTFDDQERLWAVVKDDSDQDPDGARRIDKDTGQIQHTIYPNFPNEINGGYLEGLAWDGSGLWVSAVRSGLAGNMLTRVDPLSGQQIAPFDSGPLGTAGKVDIAGNIAQGLLYDPSGNGYLWHSDVGLKRIYKLDVSLLYDGDPGNDDDLVVAQFDVPFEPKGMDWMEDKIWVASPDNSNNNNRGVWEFDPATGATVQLFHTPAMNLDGLAILEDPGPALELSTETIEQEVWIHHPAVDDSFTVRNRGGDLMTYTITDDVAWLSVNPDSGDSTGEADTITVSYTGIETFAAGDYPATITVDSPDAYNAPQDIAVTLRVVTAGPDLDEDADVDMTDFGLLQACLTGTGTTLPPGCSDADMDNDGGIGAPEVGLFLACFSGANLPAAPGCDD